MAIQSGQADDVKSFGRLEGVRKSPRNEPAGPGMSYGDLRFRRPVASSGAGPRVSRTLLRAADPLGILRENGADRVAQVDADCSAECKSHASIRSPQRWRCGAGECQAVPGHDGVVPGGVGACGGARGWHQRPKC